MFTVEAFYEGLESPEAAFRVTSSVVTLSQYPILRIPRVPLKYKSVLSSTSFRCFWSAVIVCVAHSQSSQPRRRRSRAQNLLWFRIDNVWSQYVVFPRFRVFFATLVGPRRRYLAGFRIVTQSSPSAFSSTTSQVQSAFRRSLVPYRCGSVGPRVLCVAVVCP